MLERHFTSERVNEIFNNPSILPFLGGEHKGYLDLSNAVKNTDNVFLVGENGCVFFLKLQEGLYDFHTAVLPEGRGQWMLDGSIEAFDYMFTKTDAFELLTQCPEGNLASKAGARAVGCTYQFTTRPVWLMQGKLVPVEIWSIVIQNWVKLSKSIEKSGIWYHNILEEQYKELNKKIEIHEEDSVHNKYVGATVEMIRSGFIAKALAFYNRFAVLARYVPIKVLSLNPLVIDIQESVIQVNNDTFEVLNAWDSSRSSHSRRS
jgi:hypothetical protein